LWDTMDATLAERCRAFYRQRPRPLPAFIRNNFIVHDSIYLEELALDSPTLFQRWVCWEAAIILLGYRVPGVTYGTDSKPLPPMVPSFPEGEGMPHHDPALRGM